MLISKQYDTKGSKACLLVAIVVLTLAFTGSVGRAGLADGVGGLRVAIEGEGGGGSSTSGTIVGAKGGTQDLGREDQVIEQRARTSDITLDAGMSLLKFLWTIVWLR